MTEDQQYGLEFIAAIVAGQHRERDALLESLPTQTVKKIESDLSTLETEYVALSDSLFNLNFRSALDHLTKVERVSCTLLVLLSGFISHNTCYAARAESSRRTDHKSENGRRGTLAAGMLRSESQIAPTQHRGRFGASMRPVQILLDIVTISTHSSVQCRPWV